MASHQQSADTCEQSITSDPERRPLKNSIKLIASCALLATAGATFASGSHSGGHDGDTIGKPGVASKVTRTINVDMSDAMRFSPADINVKQGETIRFVVKNSGKLSHEFALGTTADLKAHNELMKKNPGMEHAEDNMVTVKPGQSGEVLWQFTKATKVDFACLHVGHFDAGMKGSIAVASASLMAQPTVAVKDAELSSGEVKKVDLQAQKITLKHGELKNLEMPGMTMVFKVTNPSLLDKVKAGDKVNFTAEKRGGAFVVTAIEVAS